MTEEIPQINVSLNKAEIDTMVAVLDAGVKAIGLHAVNENLISALKKIAEASAAQQKEKNADG